MIMYPINIIYRAKNIFCRIRFYFDVKCTSLCYHLKNHLFVVKLPFRGLKFNDLAQLVVQITYFAVQSTNPTWNPSDH